jgi:hypothetical protein
VVDLSINIRADGLPRLDGAFETALGDVMFRTASEVEAHAKNSILAGEKSGRIHRSGGRDGALSVKGGAASQPTARQGEAQREHRASAPGESPANDTGNLANSIGTERVDSLTSMVTVGAEYGADLEFGTTKMEPRPFIGPAIAAAEPGLGAALERLVKQEL